MICAPRDDRRVVSCSACKRDKVVGGQRGGCVCGKPLGQSARSEKQSSRTNSSSCLALMMMLMNVLNVIDHFERMSLSVRRDV